MERKKKTAGKLTKSLALSFLQKDDPKQFTQEIY